MNAALCTGASGATSPLSSICATVAGHLPYYRYAETLTHLQHWKQGIVNAVSMCHFHVYVFKMVQTLASNGANSIWEHSLLDPAQVQSGRRKPNPQDKVQ